MPRRSLDRRRVRYLLISLSVLLSAYSPEQASAQKASKPYRTDPSPTRSAIGWTSLPLPDHRTSPESLPSLQGVEPYNPVWMELFLDRTQCQIHRSGDYSPLVVTINGQISSSNSETWCLSVVSPEPGGSPDLYFIGDMFGRGGPPHGGTIPLIWEISLNGGDFVPMMTLPDNSIAYTFPPGGHTFQVRIGGSPGNHQSDGYYSLQVSQIFIPHL